MNKRFRHSRNAFTLIELLLVLVILGVLAAIVVPKFTGRAEDARKARAVADVATIKNQIDIFEVDCGRMPTSEEGLMALVDKPSDLTGWKGAYLDADKLKDPWGHEYLYRIPGQGTRKFDVISMGPDGREGGEDDIK